jgi:PI-3-kinase-related kinase SMG-1
MATKTRPKKLVFQTTEGAKEVFLLKGRDDLTLDVRLLQMLRLANALSPGKGAIRVYDVFPIEPRAGLLRWVTGHPMHGLTKGAEEASSAVWARKVKAALQQAKVLPQVPRKEWPVEILLRNFKEMCEAAPKNLLSRELFQAAVSPDHHLHVVENFRASVARMSAMGYVLGLGDRHLDNILLDLQTGEVCHVDFSIAFDFGKKLKVPETVPFRLTQNMEHALGYTKTGGTFKLVMTETLASVRRGRELFRHIAETFYHDPLHDWVAPPTTLLRAVEEQKRCPPKSSGRRRRNGKVSIDGIPLERLWPHEGSPDPNFRDLCGRVAAAVVEGAEDAGVLQEIDTAAEARDTLARQWSTKVAADWMAGFTVLEDF